MDVIVERTATVFEHTTFETLAVDDVVEVSGFPESGNNLRATRVEKKSTFVDGESSVEVKGTVASLTADSFLLGDYTVIYSNADLADVNGDLADGMYVEVYGILSGNTITASRVESEDRIQDQVVEGEELEVEGTVSCYVDLGDFKVNGVAIDATNALLQPSDLVIQDGMVLEAEGTWDGTVLAATSIELRRGRIEIEALVTSVDLQASTIELSTGTAPTVVYVTTTTLLDDDNLAGERLSLADISIGDFLEVEAYQDGERLIATRIDRDNDDLSTDIEIQGLVDG